DKLVFSNGIIILAIFSGLLVIVFRGDTSRLIPLYAVGVFLSFTLSQSGMVMHWLRERDMQKAKQKTLSSRTETSKEKEETHKANNSKRALPDAFLATSKDDIHISHAVIDEVTGGENWKKSIAINAIGAVATFVVLVVFIITKFIHGTWVVVMVI